MSVTVQIENETQRAAVTALLWGAAVIAAEAIVDHAPLFTDLLRAPARAQTARELRRLAGVPLELDRVEHAAEVTLQLGEAQLVAEIDGFLDVLAQTMLAGEGEDPRLTRARRELLEWRRTLG